MLRLRGALALVHMSVEPYRHQHAVDVHAPERVTQAMSPTETITEALPPPPRPPSSTTL